MNDILLKENIPLLNQWLLRVTPCSHPAKSIYYPFKFFEFFYATCKFYMRTKSIFLPVSILISCSFCVVLPGKGVHRVMQKIECVRNLDYNVTKSGYCSMI